MPHTTQSETIAPGPAVLVHDCFTIGDYQSKHAAAGVVLAVLLLCKLQIVVCETEATLYWHTLLKNSKSDLLGICQWV